MIAQVSQGKNRLVKTGQKKTGALSPIFFGLIPNIPKVNIGYVQFQTAIKNYG